MSKNSREANMELLRIIAMLLIILYHAIVHGMNPPPDSYTGVNRTVSAILLWGGALGNNSFILISGFFLVYAKFKWEKVFRLIFQMTFYSILLYVISMLVGVEAFRVKHFIQALVPWLSGGGYWFLGGYLLLYFAMPLINKGIEGISQRQFATVIIIFFTVYCVFETIIHKVISINEFGYSSITWMVLVYCIGAYLRKYGEEIFKHKLLIYFMLPVSCGLAFAATIIKEAGILRGNSIIAKIVNLGVGVLADWRLNAIMPFLIALLMFLLFKTLNIQSAFIANVGKTTLGIYLIHDNEIFRDFIWYRVFQIPKFQEQPYFFAIVIGSALLVFVSCAMVEGMRQRFIENPLFHWKPVVVLTDRFQKWTT